MTTPTGIETFGNQPTGTVTSGGTTTSDTAFTVTATDTWPAASASTVPKTFFRFTDQANTSEIMIATTAPGGSGSGQSWTVIRGAEGTTAISHSASWTCQQLITAGTLQQFKQASTAATSAVTVATTTETLVATYQPPASAIVNGASFEAVAYGTFVTNNATAVNREMIWTLRWGGVTGTILCQITTNGNAAALTTTSVAGSSFDVNGTVTLLSSTSATANLNLFYNNSSNSLVAAQSTATATNATTGLASSATPATISGSGPLVLTAKWGGTVTNQTLTAVAPLIYRAA